jgi:hypothetical protein
MLASPSVDMIRYDMNAMIRYDMEKRKRFAVVVQFFCSVVAAQLPPIRQRKRALARPWWSGFPLGVNRRPAGRFRLR